MRELGEERQAASVAAAVDDRRPQNCKGQFRFMEGEHFLACSFARAVIGELGLARRKARNMDELSHSRSCGCVRKPQCRFGIDGKELRAVARRNRSGNMHDRGGSGHETLERSLIFQASDDNLHAFKSQVIALLAHQEPHRRALLAEKAHDMPAGKTGCPGYGDGSRHLRNGLQLIILAKRADLDPASQSLASPDHSAAASPAPSIAAGTRISAGDISAISPER